MSDAAVDVFADAFEEDPIVVTAEQARFARAWDRAVAALPEWWTLDGLLRIYGAGHESDGWCARAYYKAPRYGPVRVRVADTPAAALEALADALEGRTG